MKLFVIADIHGALDPFDRGRDIIRRCDAVVIAGDLCRRGKPADAMKVIKKVESINRTIIAVPGNWDPAPVMMMSPFRITWPDLAGTGPFPWLLTSTSPTVSTTTEVTSSALPHASTSVRIRIPYSAVPLFLMTTTSSLMR